MSSEALTSPPATSAPESNTNSNVRDLKPVIKNVDMSDDMQSETIEIAYDALEKFTVEKDMAGHVKRTMDQKFGPTWHAVVGQRYGSYVTHETKHFIYFCELESSEIEARAGDSDENTDCDSYFRWRLTESRLGTDGIPALACIDVSVCFLTAHCRAIRVIVVMQLSIFSARVFDGMRVCVQNLRTQN
ncbi:hypothetical protein PHSY_000783 [Pseudozyma hubeiensis SY62]|uniref:Dynein light chain 1, cytoplasmic n=1 Tax=Pseudozyma hubeiensis (strain SY62) TaxID=1305764 RepID=R9P535_PSEHS|nr:hypothetical protein PHSY_000783 [Pseudozyma hubeiensis SY62]GAC93220.1 hypothetical protein PHSY_000783 [Pseudozyma hubeiensis SY62]